MIRSTSLLVFCLGCLTLAQQPPAAQGVQKPAHQTHKSKRHKAPTAEPASPPPAPDPQPQVTYENGLLTIVAENATLRSVLDLIHARTGAVIKAPADLSQKVATTLGPAPPSKVIGDLLDQAGLDYVVLGAPDNPNAISEIRVQPRAKIEAPVASAPAEPPATAPANPDEGATKADQNGGDEGVPDDPAPDKEQNAAPSPSPIPTPGATPPRDF